MILGVPELVASVGVIGVASLAGCALVVRLFYASLPRGTKRLADGAERVEAFERLVGELEEGQRATGAGSDVERRLAELEERLDFAERLLAQQRDAPVGPAKS